MTRSQRTKLVESRADLILAGDSATEDYALHFDAQLRRSAVQFFRSDNVIATERLRPCDIK